MTARARASTLLRRLHGGGATATSGTGAGTQQLQRHYAKLRESEPIDEQLAVFGAYWFRGHSCNPRAIDEKARELVPGHRGVWVVRKRDKDAFPADVEHVVAGTRPYYELLARAKYFVNNVNFPNHYVKREGQIHVQTHHGTPLKTMGLDMARAPGREKETDYEAMMARVARWDFSISANAFTTEAWRTAYPGDYEHLETGYPRNDDLANATPQDVARARAALGIAVGERTVLYAPTHREYDPPEDPYVDLSALAETLGPGHLVLSRAHYFEEPRAGATGGRVRDVSAHSSVQEVCLAADVLITDFSSIMFDYAVLDRPIVSHVPDWETYRHRRGTYFDLLAEPPGPPTRSTAETAETIQAGDPGADLRRAFRERFCALEDGGSSERVVRRVWGLD